MSIGVVAGREIVLQPVQQRVQEFEELCHKPLPSRKSAFLIPLRRRRRQRAAAGVDDKPGRRMEEGPANGRMGASGGVPAMIPAKSASSAPREPSAPGRRALRRIFLEFDVLGPRKAVGGETGFADARQRSELRSATLSSKRRGAGAAKWKRRCRSRAILGGDLFSVELSIYKNNRISQVTGGPSKRAMKFRRVRDLARTLGDRGAFLRGDGERGGAGAGGGREVWRSATRRVRLLAASQTAVKSSASPAASCLSAFGGASGMSAPTPGGSSAWPQ